MSTTATLPDGRSVEIPDGQTALEAYYASQGATITKTVESAPDFPRVFNGGDGYVGEQAAEPVEQLSDGEVTEPDGAAQVPGGEPAGEQAGTSTEDQSVEQH